jgi:hypothetical protein
VTIPAWLGSLPKRGANCPSLKVDLKPDVLEVDLIAPVMSVNITQPIMQVSVCWPPVELDYVVYHGEPVLHEGELVLTFVVEDAG